MKTSLKQLLLLALVAQLATGCKVDNNSDDDGGTMAGVDGGTGGEGGMGGEGGTGGTGGEGGMGGEGGTGGVGGEGGSMVVTGSGSCDDPYTFSEQADGSFRATGTLSGDDSVGSCAQAADNAFDAVVSFVAPAAGIYEFSTAETFGVDTVLYVRSSCATDGADLACNDDVGGEDLTSKLTVELEADQQVFVVVDTFGGAEGAEGIEFVVTGAAIEANAPVLASVEGAFDPSSYMIGFRAQGTDADSDVVSLGFTLVTPAGDVGPFEVNFADLGEVTFDGESFTGEVGGAGDESFAGATGARVYVIDALGLMSDEVELEFSAPAYLNENDACSIIDGFNVCGTDTVCEAGDDGLNGTCVLARKPTVSNASIAFDPNTFSIGVRVEGIDPDQDVDTLGIVLMGTAEAIDPIEVPFADFGSIVTDADIFVGSIFAAGDESFIGWSSAMVYVIDSRGLSSEPVEVMVGAPSYLAEGDACSATDGFSICGEGTSCGIMGEATEGTCVTAVKPVLSSGEAFFNAETLALGVRLNGTDSTVGGPYVNGMGVTIFDESGADIFGQSFVLDVEMTNMGADFVTTTSAGYPEDTAAPASLAVTVVTSVGEESDPLTLTVGTMVPVAAEGEYCDDLAALASCAEGSACINNACLSEASWVTECPAEFTVTPLTAAMSISGDNSASANSAAGTCGGGGPVDVYSFTAETAGAYTFSADAVDAGTTDMLMYVRSHCGYAGQAFELGCNDDVDGQNMNFNSAVEATLEAGQTVYVFVDSYSGSAAGAYTVSVSAN